jgi:protein-S-isoprenylcysteine O-methyltransferase Ste14
MSGAARYFVSRVLMTGLFGLVLVVAAGQFGWSRAWVYIGVVLLAEALSEAIVMIVNPALLSQRGTLMWADTRLFDKVFIVLWVPLGYSSAVVAGLDKRFGWSSLPFATVYAGALLTALGYVVGTWAMAVNTYFEPTTRVQAERKHQVITSGPYQIVRHPGYVGAILGALAAPLFLGSAWMFAPTAGIVLLFVGRTALEDVALQSELPGYETYAKSTPYRLLPRIW